MEVIKLNLWEMPEFNDQSIRTYETDLKSGMIEDALRARTEGELRGRENARDAVSMRQVSRFASNMIRPNGNSGVANIAGGWHQARFRFVMVVCTEDRSYRKSFTYITGYTDHADINQRGMESADLDPGMRMYFNSISNISLLATAESNYDGYSYRPKSDGHDQVLNRNSFGDRKTRDAALIRPVDMTRRYLSSGDQLRGNIHNNYSKVTDRVGVFAQSLSMSTRRNNTPSSFLHRSINTYHKSALSSISDASGWEEQLNSEVLNDVCDHLDENLLESNSFVDAQLRENTNILRSGYVTYGELEALNPGLRNSNIVSIKPIHERDRFKYEDAMSNRADTPESHAANILAASLLSLMLDSSISRIEDMVIDSHARYEEDRVIIGLPFPYMDGMDIEEPSRQMIHRIEETIIPDITRNDAFAVEAHVHVIDVEGVIDVEISVDGGPLQHYVFPLFADALIAPTLSDDIGRLDTVATDVFGVSEAFFQSNVLRTERNNRTTGERGNHSRSSRVSNEPSW